MRYLLILLTLITLAPAPAINAQTAATGTTAVITPATSASNTATPAVSPATSTVKVWVNTATGVYHMPGSRWYGNTKQGKYMTEDEAIQEGDRKASNGQ